MHSYARMNGQYRQVGSPSQSSQAATQLTHDPMWSQQVGTANNSCQYRTSNTVVQPPQSAHVTFRNGAYFNRQMSNWQTPAVPHQAVSSQLPAGEETNSSYLTVLHGNLQNSFTNTQSGNPPTSGFINSSSPPNMMKANASYPQQDTSAHWNQQGSNVVHWRQSKRTLDGNALPNFQYSELMKSLLQNRNGELTKPPPPYPTTPTSLPHKQVVRSSTVVSATAHNRQTAYDQSNRQNGTQHGFSPSIPSSNYSMVVSQSFGNGNITANSSSSEQVFHVSSIGQKTQQYPIHINSTHNREETTRHFLSETNENSSADKQEQEQIIARIVEDLQNSFTESSDCHPPAYTPATYKGNSNASQSLPLSSGLSLPKTTNSVMSRIQHSVDVPPQQSSAPNAFYVSATGDGSGNVFFPESNRASNGNIAGSLSDASQLMKLLESISPQRNKTGTSVANNSDMHEILEKLSSAKANDSTVHSSPSRTGMRAVAVVQPLSQECYQVASSNTINQSAEYIASDESLNNPEKLCISPAVEKTKKDLCLREGSNLYPENPNQMISNKYVISDSAASNDGTCLSDSAGHQEVSRSQLCTDDTGSEVAVNMDVDQSDTPAAPQPVTSEVPRSQNGDEDKNENPAELSSVPTIPWTTAKLMKFIQNAENAQRKLKRNLTNLSVRDSVKKIFSLFWDDEIKNISCKLKMGWYKNLNTDVVEFLREYLTPDTVILSQVKDLKQLKNYYVLKDDAVYSEPPYKSSWLNVNEQLDDIDKEFGFPWSLKHRLHILESHSQQGQVVRVDSIPAQIVSDAPNSVLSQTELEPPEDKQASTVKATPVQEASPNDTESVDSSDPYYSFEIQVLPPEDAKLIFEQVQSKMPQSRDTDSQPEGVTNSSLEAELPEDTDVTLNDSDFESESVCPIAQVCCIARLKEMFYGSNTPSLSKCQCKNDQTLKDFPDNTLDKEEMAVHKELCGELSQTIAVTENSNNAHSFSDNSKNISKRSINGSLPTIILISEDEDEDLSSSDTEIQSNPEEDCKQGLFKSPGSTQSCILVSSDKEIEKLPSSEGEVASQMSDLEETCGQAQLTSTDAAESSSETAEQHQTTFSLSREHETVERKWKRESSNDRFFPIFKKANKYNPPVDVESQPSTCRKVLSDAPDGEPSASNVRAVQLVLFGSAPQDKCVLIGSRRSHMSSPGVVSDGVPSPPEVVSVKLSPLKRKSSETVPMGELSVKRRIHEKWRSFLPTKIGHRSKLKTQKRNFASLSGASFKKAEAIGPSNTEKLPVSNEMRTWNQNTKRCRSLKRRRTLSDRLRHAEVKMKKGVVTLKRPADEERNTKKSNTENGRYTVTRLPEKNVLRFSVLPNTFNLMEQDGFSETKETEDPDLDKSDPVEEKDKCSNKTILREKGTWYPNPEKKYCPLRSPPVPKTSIVFREFQRKYMEKMQPSFDE